MADPNVKQLVFKNGPLDGKTLEIPKDKVHLDHEKKQNVVFFAKMEDHDEDGKVNFLFINYRQDKIGSNVFSEADPITKDQAVDIPEGKQPVEFKDEWYAYDPAESIADHWFEDAPPSE